MVKHLIARVTLGRISVGAALEPSDQPDASFEAIWRRRLKRRLLITLGVLGLWAVALEARLVQLQVIEHEDYVARARHQQQNVIEQEAPRGDIIDRNGEVMAYSVESHRVIADPSQVKDAKQEAAEICAALGDCTAKEQAQHAAGLARDRNYYVIRNPRFVSPAAAARVQALIASRREQKRPVVVSLLPESRRYYPKKELASHVLGFVDDSGAGAGGIEGKYDRVIAGVPGKVLVQVDGRGSREIATHVERAPKPGATLELTLDLRLQYIAEQALREAVVSSDAAGGSVVMMAPGTGEILALANYPPFNPNVYWQESDDARRNRVVTDTYEPGSTFKIVTASAALNERLYRTTELIDTNPGVIRLPGRVIDEAHGKNHGVLSFEDVVVRSSNVGAVRIAERIGPDRMLQYIRRFGFGEALSPDFGGQSRGRVHQAGEVTESALASLAMGYEIGVTPVQVASATSVVANGGVLMEPRIVRAIIRDGRREVIEPKPLRRVISPETAMTVTALMEGVVEHGTATGAALDRYQVAGKTGTAAKVVNRRYSTTDYNVSFVGFVPSRRPALTILVVIDTPRRGEAYGGKIAAPVFKRIAEAGLQQLGIPPSIHPASPVVKTAARPAATPGLRSASMIPTITRVGGRPVMPDLRGLTLRDALRVANALGLSMTTDGDGVVTAQSPAPDAFVEPGDSATIQLRRLPASPGGDR